MKVLLINGSPHREGCTHTALAEVAAELEKQGVETREFWIGPAPAGGCLGCGGCARTGRCVQKDKVNEALELLPDIDGLIVGSPVHYAAASGSVTGFLDRLFYAGGAALRYKPGAAVVSARRAGTTAALDQLNKYFTIDQMPLVSSQYWNMVHGNTPDQVRQDAEGMQTMRQLARNMAWMLRCLEAGRAAGVPLPENEEKVRTNFIR